MAYASIPAPFSATASAGSALPKPKKVIVDVYDNDPVEDNEALLIYRWLDSLQFSRSRKTAVNRDFADGVMMAEVVANYIPKIINATYYIPTSASSKKIANWEELNNKVFKRIGFQLTPDTIKELAAGRSGLIERVLKAIQPILFKGSKAVLPVSRKLENVKARFMDFDKKPLQKKTLKERPQTAQIAEPTFRPRSRTPSRSRPRSAVNNFTPRFRSRVPSQDKNEVPLEMEVIRRPMSPAPKTIKEKRPQISMSDRYKAGHQQSVGENYKIFKNPSTTGKSVDNATSRKNFNEIDSLKKQKGKRQLVENGNNNDENTGMVVSSKKRGFPVSSSWLPEHDKGQPLDNNGNFIGEEEADAEIYCQSGYEEDTEENEDSDASTTTSDNESGDTMFVPDSKSKRKTRKRRMKRVVKYEYREEFILNGMAQIQLPNSVQLETVRKDYMNPGNKDTNCRGYGFV